MVRFFNIAILFYAFQKETFIYEYVGEVLTQRQLHTRLREYHREGQRHRYIMELDDEKNFFIDATRKANVSRYMNHCCDPNCEIRRWKVGAEIRIGCGWQ